MKQNRIFNLDVCRALAILSIVFNHALNSYTSISNAKIFYSLNYFERMFIAIGYILSLIGVPLFLALTGALILNKKFENGNDIKKFYKHNLLNLVISVSIWNIIYYFLGLYIFNLQFDWKHLVLTVLFQFITYHFHGVYHIDNDFLLLLITSLLAFELIRRIKPKKNFKTIEYISRISLGIYFIHRIIMYLFSKFIKFEFSIVFKVLICYVVGFGLSVLIIWLLSKIKVLKKYVLCVK